MDINPIISFASGDFSLINSLDSAIIVSLFTDARATSDQIVYPENRRGWLPNISSPVEGRELGSLLWLVNQKRLTQTTLNKSINYVELALNWLVEDKIIKTFSITGEIIPKKGIKIIVNIISFTGEYITNTKNLWEY